MKVMWELGFGLAVLFVMAIILVGCTDAPTAERVLRQAGYTKVITTGYSMFACAESDLYSTGFKAVSPNGEIVTGVVCGGVFKGSTIRHF